MRKSKGYRNNTRRLLSRNPRERGKISLSRLLYAYKEGEKVVVKIDASVHRGMPHRRFHGKIGTIVTKRGRSYVIDVPQGDSVKEIIVRPEHLVPYANVIGD